MRRAAVLPRLQRADARSLRREPTVAEARLRWLLRQRQLEGYKFSRQIAIGPYIADFACRERRLAVEVASGQHGEAHDVARQAWI